MSTLLNTETTYMSLQPFSSMDELNENTVAIRAQYSDQLTPSTLQVLDVLHRYACKYPGVSYRSKNKIADELGINRKTVTRACKQLEDLGIIQQHELKRHNGDKRRAADAIVFVPIKPLESNNVPTECPGIEALANTQKSKPSNTLDTDKPVVDKKRVVKEVEKTKVHNDPKHDIKRGLRDKMPAFIYDLLSPYLNLEDLYEAYGTLLRGKASIDKSITFESYQGLYSDAVLSVIHAYKRGVVLNLFAVLFTAAQDTTAQIYRRDNYNVPNWLQW